MKSVRKNDQGVSPVIAVILMVAITVVLAGVLYLWVSSLAETDKKAEFLDVKGTITDATADTLVFEIRSGGVTWTDYYVKIDGTTETAGTSPAGTSNSGDTATFDFAAVDTFTTGTTYNIKIVNIADNAVVWEDDIIAKAG